MTSLHRTLSESSVKSTNSFDSEAMDENEVFDFAPRNIFYVNPDTSDKMLILSQGEPLPVLETKYKRMVGWTYGLKFRFVPKVILSFI